MSMSRREAIWQGFWCAMAWLACGGVGVVALVISVLVLLSIASGLLRALGVVA